MSRTDFTPYLVVGMDSTVAESLIVKLVREQLPKVRAIYLFGSRADASGRYVRTDSDYDIAFLLSHKPLLTGQEKLAFQADLASALKVEWVDLVDVGSNRDHTLQMNVIRGKRLFAEDLDDVIEWEAKAITMAQDWYTRSAPFRNAEMADIRARVATYRQEET